MAAKAKAQDSADLEEVAVVEEEIDLMEMDSERVLVVEEMVQDQLGSVREGHRQEETGNPEVRPQPRRPKLGESG